MTLLKYFKNPFCFEAIDNLILKALFEGSASKTLHYFIFMLFFRNILIERVRPL